MSSRSKRSTKKKKLSDQVILVDRREYKRAFQLISMTLQSLGEEFEMIRSDKDMDPDLRRTLMHVYGGQIVKLQSISMQFQVAFFNPMDPNGTIGEHIN